MKWIKRLEIRNALGIEEFEISPGKTTLIQGENETGKTSILECIEKVLYNRNRRADFVRRGEENAVLYAEINDEIKIDKKVFPDGVVRGTVIKDGIKQKSQETLLKSIVGEYSFNPVDFLMKPDKEQTEILLSLIPIRITEEQLKEWTGEIPKVNLNRHAIEVLEELAEEYYYDQRTIANTKFKDIKDQIESLRAQLPDNYNPEEWKDIELFSLHEKVRSAQDYNLKIEEAKKFVEEFDTKKSYINQKYDLRKKTRLEDDKERISEIKEEINKLKQEMASIEGKQSEALKEIEEDRKTDLRSLDEAIEERNNFLKDSKIKLVEELKEKAKTAEIMKGYLNLANNLKTLEKDKTIAEKEAIRLDKLVDYLRKKPAELLSKIKLPVKGLGINEQMQITIDGLPITNLSTSRKIWLAVEIARATSGELKIICVDRFETLDEEHKKLFFKEIATDGFQYFITEVTEGPLKITDIKGK